MLLVFEVRAHCCLIFNLFTRNLRCFLQCCFSADHPQPMLRHGAVPAPELHLAFAFVGLHEVSVGSFSSPPWSLWKAAQPPSASATAPRVLPHSQNVYSGHLSRVLVTNEDVKPYWPRTISWGAYSPAGFQMNFIPLMHPFESSSQPVFNPLHKSFQCGWISGCPLYTFTLTTPHFMVSRIRVSRNTSFIELDILLPSWHEFKMRQLWKNEGKHAV